MQKNIVSDAGDRNPVLRLRQGYGACTLLGTGCFTFYFLLIATYLNRLALLQNSYS
jgi:hypothetical protein